MTRTKSPSREGRRKMNNAMQSDSPIDLEPEWVRMATFGCLCASMIVCLFGCSYACLFICGVSLVGLFACSFVCLLVWCVFSC